MLRRDLAIGLSPLWYRRYRVDENADYVICRHLLQKAPKCDTSGRYTVNYRISVTANSVDAAFFLKGNAVMRERFGDDPPWRAKATAGPPANEA
jgi:hypothetical protein